MAIVHDDLFNNFLISPIANRNSNIYIVSGYATARMAMRHLDEAKKYLETSHFPIKIHLILGMCSRDGLSLNNHAAIADLQSRLPNNFECRYNIATPVHSKVYAWAHEGQFNAGFIGSANYTQNAFSSRMREVLTWADGNECKSYYDYILGDTISCLDQTAVEDSIYLYEDIERPEGSVRGNAENASEDRVKNVGECLELSLLDSRTRQTPARSGINWGQRAGRDHNQAYISVPASVARSGFFPVRGKAFTLITDDGKQIICSIAQQGDKAIHSTINNSYMGEYLRYRIGVQSGAYVNTADLENYGRSSVTICKLDDENYTLDFSV